MSDASVPASHDAPAPAVRPANVTLHDLGVRAQQDMHVLQTTGALSRLRKCAGVFLETDITIADSAGVIGLRRAFTPASGDQRGIALIPGHDSSREADGSYELAIAQGGRFQRTGITLHAVDGQLALRDHQRQFVLQLRALAGDLPASSLRPAVAPREVRSVEYAIPGTSKRLVWDRNAPRRGGAFAIGWQAELHEAHRPPRAVFVKVMRDVGTLTQLVDAEATLTRTQRHNPDLSRVYSRSLFQGTVQPTPALSDSASTKGVGMTVEPYVAGPTLEQVERGTWTCRGVCLGPPRLHQVAAIGALVASGLRHLNENVPEGERLIAPDFCKVDNIMIPEEAIDPLRGFMPRRITFIDKDSVLDERKNVGEGQSVSGHPLFTDIDTIVRMVTTGRYDVVDSAHAYQVGRLLLVLASKGDLPRMTLKEAGLAEGVDDHYVYNTQRWFEKAVGAYEAAHAGSPDGAPKALATLIRSCCDPVPSKRPTLERIEHRLDEICILAGYHRLKPIPVREFR